MLAHTNAYFSLVWFSVSKVADKQKMCGHPWPTRYIKKKDHVKTKSLWLTREK